MQKALVLLLIVFCFIYLHKVQKLMKRSRVETYCQQFEHNNQQVRDCVACINTQKLTSTSLKFYINNINNKYETVDYYGSVKVLKQQQCQQYSCNNLLNISDYQMKTPNSYLQELTFKLQSNTTINSKQKDEIDVKLKTGEAAITLRFRVVQPVRSTTSMFVTVRYPHQDITERLAISLTGAAIPTINYFLLLAFLPGLEGVMQAYMIWCMLQVVMKNKQFPVVYALIYFTLSNLVEIELYRDLYFLCNILASVIAGILKPSKQSIIGIVVTIICVTSQYIFMTKDLVWTSTIMGYYFTLLSQKPDQKQKAGELSWTPIHV